MSGPVVGTSVLHLIKEEILLFRVYMQSNDCREVLILHEKIVAIRAVNTDDGELVHELEHVSGKTFRYPLIDWYMRIVSVKEDDDAS